MKIGDKRETEQWLDAERENPDAFGQLLVGKLKDWTGPGIGPGCSLHYQNVAIAYTHLYGFDMEGVGANAALVTRSGDQGSIAELRVPSSAGLLRKAFNIVVGPELTWSAIATTTDFASEARAVTARNALEYYWRHENVGQLAKSVQFESMAFAEGALHIPWDADTGTDAGVEKRQDGSERIVKSGSMRFSRIPTWDIIRDPSARSFEALNTIIVREWPDKHDTAAPFKDSADPADQEKYQACMNSGATDPIAHAWMPFGRFQWNANTQRIPVYYLYAKRTPSCPQGRQTVFLEDGTVLSDGPLDEAYVLSDGSCLLPVARTSSGEYAGTPWPYTKWFGTLGADQARDGLRRDLLTNATAVSGNVIAAPESMMDAAAAATEQGGGPKIVGIPDGADGSKIKVLELRAASPEHFKLDATLANEQQQLMGIDNITAGEEVGANLSGAAMALMTSTSVQNNSQEQAGWTAFVQRVGNIVLRHVQKHMKVAKRIALAGNARSSLVTTTELSGESVQGIERVLVSIGSALQQTDAGKYEIATTALKNNWVKTPEDFQTVLDTGRLDALTEGTSNSLLLIKNENEALARGEAVPVVLEDDHRLHLKKHPEVLSSLTARRDPKVVAAVQAHDDQHLRMLIETDPRYLQSLGQPVLAPMGPPGAPGAPPPDAPKPPQAEQKANAPSMPTNPATQQKAAPAAGTVSPQLAVRPS